MLTIQKHSIIRCITEILRNYFEIQFGFNLDYERENDRGND